MFWPACGAILVITPPRPANLRYSSSFTYLSPRGTMANSVRVSRSAIGIVTRVRCDERSSALPQFARFRRGTTESRSWAPAYSPPRRRRAESSAIGQIGGADTSEPRDLNVVRSAASLAPVVAMSVAFCAARSFASAMRYSPYRASAEMPASRSLNASEYGGGSHRSARSRWLSSSAT
jgi:hypothetical protein